MIAALHPLFRTGPGAALARALFRLWLSAVSAGEPRRGLRALLGTADLVQGRIDELAIRLDDGVHAKHRLTGYHDFFVERVRPGERVLDVGCGKGELAHDLAVRASARVTGLDVNPASVRFARERFGDGGVEFVEGDILTWEPPHAYDVVVLSNVLEHIEPRVELLSRLRLRAAPSRVLIRVPMIERDWLVPLRSELGLWPYSDPTHETEYTPAQLRDELAVAGLQEVELIQRWGELWAVAEPASVEAVLTTP